jgi:hypothetical protein
MATKSVKLGPVVRVHAAASALHAEGSQLLGTHSGKVHALRCILSAAAREYTTFSSCMKEEVRRLLTPGGRETTSSPRAET